MEKERINLFVTKEQLDLIENSVKERCALWKRTLAYHSGNEGVGGDIEECSDEGEAEYVVGVYDELYRELSVKVESMGANQVQSLAMENLEGAYERLEVFALSRGDWEQVVYVYQRREADFLFFPSTWQMVQFFKTGNEPEHRFSSDAGLHVFMRHWGG